MAMMLHGGENQSLELAKLYIGYTNNAYDIIVPGGSDTRPKYVLDESSRQTINRGDVFIAKQDHSNLPGSLNLDKYIFVVTSNSGSIRLPVGLVFDLRLKEPLDSTKDIVDYWKVFSAPSILEPGMAA